MNLHFVRLWGGAAGSPYGSYSDFLRLAELSGYSIIDQEKVDLEADAVYVVAPANGNTQGWAQSKRRCKFILWQLERLLPASNPDDFAPACYDEVWVSDRWTACKPLFTGRVRYVTLGGHPGLGGELNPDPKFDLAVMSYLYGRREHLLNTVCDGKLIKAPNAWPPERDQILSRCRAGICLHQHDADPAIEPLRYVLFACWKLPLVCESVIDPWPYNIYGLNEVRQGMDDPRLTRESNYRRITGELSFRKCVDKAISAAMEEWREKSVKV